MYEEDIQEELLSLEGLNPGQICHKVLKHDAYPQVMYVIEAALLIRDAPHLLTDWLYVDQWSDGTTIWKSPDRTEMATVDIEGKVRVEKI